MRKLLDEMLQTYYIAYMKTPSKILINLGLRRNLERSLTDEVRYEYVNYCKYRGISLEFSIVTDFIVLEK